MITATCPRCGWAHSEQPVPTVIEDWPEGLPTPPPLPAEALPHPAGSCCSPFSIDDLLYWNLDLMLPDAPPLRVFFKALIEIQGADFFLAGGKWVQEGTPVPVLATVVVDPKSVYPCHEAALGISLANREFDVTIRSLFPMEAWPTIEID